MACGLSSYGKVLKFMILTLPVALLMTGCKTASSSHVGDKQLLRNLTKLNDRNEAAYAYHQKCLKDVEEINPVFLRNFEVTTSLLFDQAIKVHDRDAQDTRDEILNRRTAIQRELSDLYKAEGCSSDQAQNSRRHYRDFSQLSSNQIRSLVKN